MLCILVRMLHCNMISESKVPHKYLPVVQGPAAADANVKAAAYGMSAEALNLDPRQLGQAALQPLWDNNQKLELLRVACQVQCVSAYICALTGLPWPSPTRGSCHTHQRQKHTSMADVQP